MIGSHDRRGQTTRIIGAVSAVVVIEVLYLISYNLAKTSSVGFALMLLTVMRFPYWGCLYVDAGQNFVVSAEIIQFRKAQVRLGLYHQGQHYFDIWRVFTGLIFGFDDDFCSELWPCFDTIELLRRAAKYADVGFGLVLRMEF